MSLLQLCPGQGGQRVRIVQLFAVVCRQQVWVQPNHMGGICRAQERRCVIIRMILEFVYQLLIEGEHDLIAEFTTQNTKHKKNISYKNLLLTRPEIKSSLREGKVCHHCGINPHADTQCVIIKRESHM